MTTGTSRAERRDAVANRERLLAAARSLFAERGPQVPLEDVAAAAGVSRTTLHRHFSSRDQLAVVLFEENVMRLQERAEGLAGLPDAAEQLFHEVLTMQLANRGLVYAMAVDDPEWAGVLASRTVEAFERLIESGRRAGVVRPDVEVNDVLLALHMAAGAATAVDGRDAAEVSRRIHEMLHRALFTSAPVVR